MKKTLLLLSAIAMAAPAAVAADAPEYAWANLLVGKPGQDQATAIATHGANEVYWMLTDGSTSDDRDVTYAGETLYEGALYDGTGANRNLTILKTDADGVKQWCVHSSWGEFSSGEGGLAVTSDGGIVFAATVSHSDGYLDHPVTITDANGKSTEIDWTAEKRWKRMILGTISADGELLWTRTYDLDNAPVPDATGTRTDFTSDAIITRSVAVDNNGDIYVCGNFRTDFTFPTADGRSVVLSPRNVAGWNGDSQASVGSFFLVKLDSEGYYLSHLQESGSEQIAASYMEDLSWHDGRLYAYGYMKGAEGHSVEVAGVKLTPSEYVSPIVGVFDADLKADWVKCFPGGAVDGKNAVQNVGMTVGDDAIWLAGQYNGRISDSADESKYVESTQGTLREGFIIKLASDGEWLAAADSRTDFNQTYLTGYMRVVLPGWDEDNVYVYGYAMNAAVGVFLRCYDKATLAGDPDKSWDLVTQGGVPTAQNVAYVAEADKLYLTVRGNKAFLPMGGEETENPGGYTNLLACFDMPEALSTGVALLPAETGALTVLPVDGGLKVSNGSNDPVALTIHGIDGKAVATLTLSPSSEQTLPLAPGLYIAAGRKHLVAR